MTLEPAKDFDAMSAVGASILFDEAMRKIAKGERFNLGLATGNTMISLYGCHPDFRLIYTADKITL